MARVPGDYEQAAEQHAKLDHEVKRIAVLMCEEMGVDPYGLVPNYVDGKLHSKTHWEFYFNDARKALAAWRAINKYVLTEA